MAKETIAQTATETTRTPPQARLRALSSSSSSFALRLITDYGIIVAFIIEVAAFALIAPRFFTFSNGINVALQVAITGILAAGMTMVILTGGIDLSVGSVVALTGVLSAFLMKAGLISPALDLLIVIAVAVAVGACFGAFSGLAVSKLNFPPFVVTLALMTICRGIAFIMTDGFSVGDLPSTFNYLGQGHIGPVPVLVIIMAVIFILSHVVLTRTRFGRYVYAVGSNEQASYLSGINTSQVKTAVYIINGALVGLGGVALASRLGAGVPSSGQFYELDVIAAVVVGGTSLSGGKGSVVGSFWGTVFIGVLNNGLNLRNVDPYRQRIVLGVVILLAVMLDRLKPSLKRD